MRMGYPKLVSAPLGKRVDSVQGHVGSSPTPSANNEPCLIVFALGGAACLNAFALVESSGASSVVVSQAIVTAGRAKNIATPRRKSGFIFPPP